MIKIDNAKAIEITKNKLRDWRESEFKNNDIKLQNALVDGDEVSKQEAIAYRDYLRYLTNTCDSKTLDELKAILEGIQ